MVKRKKNIERAAVMALAVAFFCCSVNHLIGTMPKSGEGGTISHISFLVKEAPSVAAALAAVSLLAALFAGVLYRSIRKGLWYLTTGKKEYEAREQRVAEDMERYDHDPERVLSLLSPNGLSCIIGKNGKGIYGYSFKDIDNIGIVGDDKMRKLSGFTLVNILNAVDEGLDIVLYDDSEGNGFKTAYPAMKAEGYEISVLDLKNPSKSGGCNILGSTVNENRRSVLAQVMCKGAGLTGALSRYTEHLLSYAFSKASDREGASLEDAYAILLDPALTSEKVGKHTWHEASKWHADDSKMIAELEKDWSKYLKVATDVLRPYAEETGLSKGKTTKEMLPEIGVPEHKSFGLIIRPAEKKSRISPISDYLLWNTYKDIEETIRNRYYAARGRKKLWRLPELLQIHILDADAFRGNIYPIESLLSTSRSANIQYIVNCRTLSAETNDQTSRARRSFGRYVVTGTPDTETAEYLSSLAGYCMTEELRPRITAEELMEIEKGDIFLIDRNTGAFKLEKAYYRNNELASCRILNTESGIAGTLSLDDYDYTKESSYEAVKGEAVRHFRSDKKEVSGE